MSKHTPGPWERRGKSVVVKGAPRRNNAYSGRICNVQGNGEGKTKINEIANANAQLIAAAPQMLEALEMAKLFIENGIEMGYISEPQPGTPESATLSAIRAAIAAAKGEL